jgi:uncharacterized NAD(P)/FAD-binding protein YdhS
VRVDVWRVDFGDKLARFDAIAGVHQSTFQVWDEPPAGLPGSETLAEHPAWMGDPWQPLENRLPSQGETIAVLGTGLTTVDIIISLRALGWMDSIHAISRHGWFPHSHVRGIEYPDFPPPGVDLADLGLEKLLAPRSAALRDTV